ncbi:hypothetical protein BJF79_43620, partial [Actinomadura sp. CNU-125]|uniref:NB-ARC domain-containing protein n=1 Tax=Actinomadura sp. CNU-125 TaxID=1904961 RepID=UPI00095CE4B3
PSGLVPSGTAPSGTAPSGLAPAVSAAGAPGVQLPPDIDDFTGREEELERLADTVLGEDDRGTVQVAAVVGMAGIGKTALVIRLAHRIGPSFPDGVLFAQLGGSGGRPVEAGTVVHQFLTAVGFAPDEIAATADERVEQFRGWSVSRRVLVVLDDASSAGQVIPLVPWGRECAAIVTGRAHGLPSSATLLLEQLSAEGGLRLLARIAGECRVQMERDAAVRIVEMCGGLPLALRAAGARLLAGPARPLERFAQELADPADRFNALRIGDLDPRAAYDAGYARLEDLERSVFQLLALLPPGPFTASWAADLLGRDQASAEAVLARLVESHFLQIVRDDPAGGLRYALPELGRIYARERLEQVIAGPERLPQAGRSGARIDVRPGARPAPRPRTPARTVPPDPPEERSEDGPEGAVERVQVEIGRF